jgi:predicted kinase
MSDSFYGKQLIILRGASGSGKSTLARSMHHTFELSVICSTDDYFMKDGEYVFNPKLLTEAHRANQDKVESCMLRSVPMIIVDNTNIQKWTYQAYIKLAETYGYEVKFVVCDGEYENRHGVPKDKVEKMRASFEPDDSFPAFTAEQVWEETERL